MNPKKIILTASFLSLGLGLAAAPASAADCVFSTPAVADPSCTTEVKPVPLNPTTPGATGPTATRPTARGAVAGHRCRDGSARFHRRSVGCGGFGAGRSCPSLRSCRFLIARSGRADCSALPESGSPPSAAEIRTGRRPVRIRVWARLTVPVPGLECPYSSRHDRPRERSRRWRRPGGPPRYRRPGVH